MKLPTPSHTINVLEAHQTLKTMAVHARYFYTNEMNLATELAKLISAGGAMTPCPVEFFQSKAEQTVRQMTPEEVAKRACDIAAAMLAEGAERDWIMPAPEISELLDDPKGMPGFGA